jgi:hypothetical protein
MDQVVTKLWDMVGQAVKAVHVGDLRKWSIETDHLFVVVSKVDGGNMRVDLMGKAPRPKGDKEA